MYPSLDAWFAFSGEGRRGDLVGRTWWVGGDGDLGVNVGRISGDEGNVKAQMESSRGSWMYHATVGDVGTFVFQLVGLEGGRVRWLRPRGHTIRDT